MKKNILILSIFSFVLLVPAVYAMPNFSHPVLGKAYIQLDLKIERESHATPLDDDSKKTIEQKKERLWNLLQSIDEALKKRDKEEMKKQAKLFRSEWKALLQFIQNPQKQEPATDLTIQKNTHGDTEFTGESTDITYYADIFEGRKTANGEVFSQTNFSAARCEIPFGTLLQVGKGSTSVIVKANDRPNCSKYPEITDLSKTAFATIGNISSGRLQGTVVPLGIAPKNYTKTLLPSDTFENLWVVLDSNIPNTYLKNETLHITGRELLGNEYTILHMKSPSGKNITLGLKKWWDSRFEYYYPLEEIGTYQMVLASGLSFKTSLFLEITVLDDALFSGKKRIVPEKVPETLEKLSVERMEFPDFTSLYLFRFPSSEFHTITIRNSKEPFVYRGFWTIAIRSETLRSADTDAPVSVEVTSEQSSTAFSHDTYTTPITVFNKTLSLVPGYKEEKNENIVIIEENGNLLIRGIIREGKSVKSDIFLTLPSGAVEKHLFDDASKDSDGFLKRGKVFEKTILLKQTGLYLVEVNYDNGFAAFNGPIVFGDFLPILPNEYDGIQKEVGTTDSSIVATESLDFVNALRAKSGKPPLSFDDALNRLASIKANDMAQSGIVSHSDSVGDKISGTAARNNITIAGALGENVAGGNVHFRVLLVGLANSGGHRANMLETWKKIGIGYTVKDGQVYFVQVFWE